MAAFMLSNFLHGEQGALMVAAQLVSAGVGTLLTGAWLATGRWTRRGAPSRAS